MSEKDKQNLQKQIEQVIEKMKETSERIEGS